VAFKPFYTDRELASRGARRVPGCGIPTIMLRRPSLSRIDRQIRIDEGVLFMDNESTHRRLTEALEIGHHLARMDPTDLALMTS
jgi:hypothetical protein